MNENLGKFSSRLSHANLNSSDTNNVKRLAYRSITLFIATLSRFYNISTNSYFDIVNEIEQIDVITQNAKYKLSTLLLRREK